MTNETTPTVILERKLANMIERGDDYLARFQVCLAQDPAYAFEGSNETFEALAEAKVAKRLLVILTTHGFDAAMQYNEQNLLNEARRVPQSTSPASNLMQAYTTAAYAKLAVR